MIHDFGQKEIVGLQPVLYLIRGAHDEIDRDTGVDSAKDFSGLFRPRISMIDNYENVQIGIDSRVAIGIRTKKDDSLWLTFCRDAIPQILDTLLVNHARALSTIIPFAGIAADKNVSPNSRLIDAPL
jgi:hypothetical protein